MKIIINKNFGNFKIGQKICIPDKGGVPTDLFWQKRLKDSEIDDCCSVFIEEKEKPKNKKQSKDSKLEIKGVK